MYKLTVLVAGEETPPVVLNRVEPGQSLLEVCLAHGLEVPHRCGGICHCTTCHLYIEKGEDFLEPKEKREMDFLNRVSDRLPQSRLACQTMLVKGRGEIVVHLPKPDLTNINDA